MKRKLYLHFSYIIPLFSHWPDRIFSNNQMIHWFRRLTKHTAKALSFLAENQEETGCWTDSSYGSQPGVVGMAILAFLARGDDPEFGPYRLHVKRAMNFLLKQQNQETGYIGSSMYNHGFATLALAEAYGLTNDLRLGPALEKASKLIVSSQKSNPKEAGDTAQIVRMQTVPFRVLSWWLYLRPVTQA